MSVERCWNTDVLSAEARRAVISVDVSIGQDKRPVSASIELGSSDASPAATRQAFEAARRAILHCGKNGLALPDGKYELWRELRLTFGTMRVGL